MSNDAHSDLTVMCYEQVEDDDGEDTACDTEVTYQNHYEGMRRKREFEGQALRLRCPECGTAHDVCPVCHGGGWYVGESTGERLACHVCNTREYRRQQRSPY